MIYTVYSVIINSTMSDEQTTLTMMTLGFPLRYSLTLCR